MMALCAVSCDKDRTGSSANKLVKEISYSNGYRMSFEYDNENRLSKVVESNGNEIYTMIYTYEGDTITEELRWENDVETLDEMTFKYYLNSEDFLTKIEVKTIPFRTLDGTGIYYYLYEYENGLLKTCRTENFSSSLGEEYEWENGDIVVRKGLYTDYYEYEYTTIENNLNNKIFAFDYLGSEYLDFKGISSQHLPKISTYNNSYGSYTTDYSYEFDADGCVTKIIMTDRNDSSDMEECNIIYY